MLHILFITKINNSVAIIVRENIYRRLDICPTLTFLRQSVIAAREICQDFPVPVDIIRSSISGTE